MTIDEALEYVDVRYELNELAEIPHDKFDKVMKTLAAEVRRLRADDVNIGKTIKQLVVERDELKRRLDQMANDYQECDEMRLRLQTDRDELKRVVEKLPKTADGAVITPDMLIWVRVSATKVEQWCVDAIEWDGSWMIQGRSIGDTFSIEPDDCYSTRKAAEQLRKEQSNGI